MGEDVLDHHRILSKGKGLPRERSECFGHDPRGPAEVQAGLDVDTVDPFQVLRPAHRGEAFRRCSTFRNQQFGSRALRRYLAAQAIDTVWTEIGRAHV